MSGVTVLDASVALDERKAALFEGDERKLDLDETRRLASGFDLDVEEVKAIANTVAATMLDGLHRGQCSPHQLVRGTWLDGLLTGLLLAEMRRREETTS